MAGLLSRTFKSKNPQSSNPIFCRRSSNSTTMSLTFPSLSSLNSPSKSENGCQFSLSSSSSKSLSQSSKSNVRSCSWLVYLILSTNPPIKTYVGVTTNFPRRLKQHNGELKGGAKASRAGRPWVCACLIEGFEDRSAACEFESKWKGFSRGLPHKKKTSDLEKLEDAHSVSLLLHRHAALNRVKDSIDCTNLHVTWCIEPL